MSGFCARWFDVTARRAARCTRSAERRVGLSLTPVMGHS